MQDSLRRKKYIAVRDAGDSDPEAYSSFFEQSKLSAFWWKSSDIDEKLRYSIEQCIVEVSIGEMLFDEKKNYGDIKNGEGCDDLLPGDLAFKAFVPVKNEAGEVESYMMTTKNKTQFDHVRELFAASMSFRQVSKVVKSNRKIFEAVLKLQPVSPGKAATLTRITCTIGLQTLSDIMKSLWSFAIDTDESNSNGDSHLDCRILFPPEVGFESSVEVSNGFQLMAILLFARAHTVQEYCDLVIMVLDFLCPNWRMKLIGSFANGAGSMAGHNSGFSTRYRNESECS